MADLRQSGSAGPGKRMQALVDRFKKETTYDGGIEAEGFHDYASKETRKGGYGPKQVTKKVEITNDTPYAGRKNQYGDVKGGKQTLTKTKTVRKNNKETTKTKQKAISNKRAKRMKEKIRENAPSIKSSEEAYKNLGY